MHTYLTNSCVLFLGHLFPDHLESAILDQPIPPIQTQRFGEALLSALIKGFEANVEVLSVAPLLDFPRSKFLVAPGARWVIADTIQSTMIPYINVMGLKHATRFIGTYCHTLAWAIKHRSSNRVIVMHGVQSCKIWGVLFACVLLHSLTISFLTDDLGIPLKWEGVFARVIRKIDVFLMKAGLRRVTGVIAMSPQLAAKLAPDRPSLIVPAIHNPSVTPAQVPNKRDGKTFTIGYFGGLHRAYGVSLLLSAFEMANRDDWCWVISGRGDLEDQLKDLAARDPRVKYLGFVASNEFSKVYENIDVLVNPKPVSTPLAFMAFPSKLVEYLGTGKPVITTNLPTLDKDFREHLIVMQADSPKELIRCLEQVASWREEQYETWGMKTRAFVENNLSPLVQGKKIRHFVDSLSLEQVCA